MTKVWTVGEWFSEKSYKIFFSSHQKFYFKEHVLEIVEDAEDTKLWTRQNPLNPSSY